jgi:hypothetical protein
MTDSCVHRESADLHAQFQPLYAMLDIAISEEKNLEPARTI